MVYEPLIGETNDFPNRYDLPNNIFDSKESAAKYAEKLIEEGLGNIFSDYGIKTSRDRERDKNRMNNWAEVFEFEIFE